MRARSIATHDSDPSNPLRSPHCPSSLKPGPDPGLSSQQCVSADAGKCLMHSCPRAPCLVHMSVCASLGLSASLSE